MNIHDLIKDLTEELDLSPEQQFRVTAKIKRLIHHEKASVYMRYAHYAEGCPIKVHTDPVTNEVVSIDREDPADPWLYEILNQSALNHEHWLSLPDEEIVTWDIGTHKYER